MVTSDQIWESGKEELPEFILQHVLQPDAGGAGAGVEGFEKNAHVHRISSDHAELVDLVPCSDRHQLGLGNNFGDAYLADEFIADGHPWRSARQRRVDAQG